ncbi:MAG TPA: EutN/CcmL family microcompartment protein [Candidatus Acidoferrales bacterium]|nr:EutN/CcmL family microcompartment protein [Candidatus Acidoferrales bacterium]
MLGRVIGNVVCTMKNATLEGHKLLLVQPIDRHGQDKGRALVAVDSVGAGAGETIYWCRGREASFPFLPGETPTEATIVGIVDTINIPSAESKR